MTAQRKFQNVETPEVKTGEKLSVEHCRKILNQDGLNFTDEEVLMIRDFLYSLATIDYLYFTEEILNKEFNNQNQNNYETDSHSLHPCEYRRAS